MRYKDEAEISHSNINPDRNPIDLPSSLAFLIFWKGTHVGLRAPVERGYR
jgi:hypothetical protein